MSIEEIMLREALALEGIVPDDVYTYYSSQIDVIFLMLSSWNGEGIDISGDCIRTDIISLVKAIKVQNPTEKITAP